MKRLLFCLCASYVLVCLCLPSAVAQEKVVWCSPKDVRWGDTLTVYYNTKATKATLSVRDEVFAKLYITMCDGWTKDTCIQMYVHDNMLVGKYVVLDSIAVGGLDIATVEREGNVGDNFFALRKDGVPARGSIMNKILSDSLAFDKEIRLYPDNYSMYLTRWSYLRYRKRLDKTKFEQEVSRDLQKLKSVTTKTPDLYAALAEAYSILDKKSEELAILRDLGKEFPHSAYAVQRLIRFASNYTNDSATKEIRVLSRSIALRFPRSSFAKEYLSRAYYIDTVLTVSIVKPIIDAWIQREPNNYVLYSIYLYLSKQSNIVSDSTVMFAQRLMDFTANRETMIRHNLDNPRNKSFAYRNAAQAFVLAGRLGQAFAAIKAAQALAPDADMQGELFALEGSVWKQSGQYALSEAAFINAQAIGSKTAKDSALAVYKQIRGTDSGFAAFLKQKSDSIAGTKKKPAIPFTAKGLDGKTYDLAALKGKAVVLNFWFIDCPPCRVEIPGLNTLVKEFTNKDVVFLALALDDEKDLKEFLKKSPFTYTIVPKAREVSQKYGVEGFPTHIVIDRNGMNVGRLVGGTEKRHEDLRPLIERALE
jgi:peroxiredoxin